MPSIDPGVYNLRIRKGADFSFTFEIDIDGTVLNLTTATVEAQIRQNSKRSSTLIDDFTVAVTTGAVTGYASDVTLSLTDAETLAVDQSNGYFDVAVTIGTDTQYYLEGRVDFTDSVTEPA